MLVLLLLVPLIGIFLLLPVEEDSKLSRIKMKKIALGSSLITLLISIIIWIEFDSNTTQYQFVYKFDSLTFFHLNLGIDGISLYFILLTTFLTPICILSNWTDITKQLKYFLISFLLLEALQICVFVVLDLLLFYVFFESVLIPLFLIIGIWGSGSKTILIRSAFLLFLYTLAGSLFMLLAIMVIYNNVGSTDFQILSFSEINFKSQNLLWLSLSFSKIDMTNRVIHSNKNNLNY